MPLFLVAFLLLLVRHLLLEAMPFATSILVTGLLDTLWNIYMKLSEAKGCEGWVWPPRCSEKRPPRVRPPRISDSTLFLGFSLSIIFNSALSGGTTTTRSPRGDPTGWVGRRCCGRFDCTVPQAVHRAFGGCPARCRSWAWVTTGSFWLRFGSDALGFRS